MTLYYIYFNVRKYFNHNSAYYSWLKKLSAYTVVTETCNTVRERKFCQLSEFVRFLELQPLKWISDTVLSNLRCRANLADTFANLVHNTKNLFNVKFHFQSLSQTFVSK